MLVEVELDRVDDGFGLVVCRVFDFQFDLEAEAMWQVREVELRGGGLFDLLGESGDVVVGLFGLGSIAPMVDLGIVVGIDSDNPAVLKACAASGESRAW